MHPVCVRIALVGGGLLLSAAPLAAAPAVASPSAAPTAAAGVQSAPRSTLSAKATVKSIGAWQQFRVYGSSTGLPAGTRVTLQQMQKKKWVSLPIHMNTTRSHTYNLRVKLGLKGLNKIRIVGGGAVSNTVQVTIR
ncbi:hypothetical protein ACIRF8_31620 [Streptomyces sp. NPDC102406]|uniref:hypothetical protein n=1 Tax=Streptomyces sp. NPDC102406 TaxID=3366171 RepID=UPI00381FB123